MLDDSFPHGTVDGYNRGCKGSHCPAPMSCRDVRTRYHADWGFRKAVDAGTPVGELLEREQLASAAAVESDRLARVAERQARVDAERAARASRRAPRQSKPRSPRARTSAPVHREPIAGMLRDRLRELHAQGMTDAQLADALEVDIASVKYTRRRIELPANRKQRAERGEGVRAARAARIREMHATGMSDQAMAAEFGVSRRSVQQARLRLGLGANRAERGSRRQRSGPYHDRRPEVAAGHAEGLSDRLIAERLGISQSEVGRLRRDLGLAAHRPPAWRKTPEQLLPHGTNASYARGCRCEPCHKAQREYYREYARRRRAEGIDPAHHGTAYGYQLGCRGRKACPAEVSCTDAMLTEERRRRREAGIPAAPDRVPAEPVREHVRTLMDAGMSVLGIADTAGVSLSGVKTLLYGRSGARAGEYPAHVEAEKARRLLALGRSTR